MDAALLAGESLRGPADKRFNVALLTAAAVAAGLLVYMSTERAVVLPASYLASPVQWLPRASRRPAALQLRQPASDIGGSRCTAERGFLVTAGAAKKVYIAGGTGRTGMRVARQCRDAGLEVVLGARSEIKTKELARQFGIDYYEYAYLEAPTWDGMYSSKPPDLRGADAVAVCLGASETEFNPSGPKTIDNELTQRVFKAALQQGGVEHVVMVSSLGTAKFGLPAAVLNLFFGVLDEKRGAELALKSSGLQYTIVRPGGMERPEDDYKKNHGTKVYEPNTQFSGQVSRLQVAEVCAEIISDPSCACNKVIELVADGDPQNVNLRRQMEAVKGVEVGADATSSGPNPFQR